MQPLPRLRLDAFDAGASPEAFPRNSVRRIRVQGRNSGPSRVLRRMKEITARYDICFTHAAIWQDRRAEPKAGFRRMLVVCSHSADHIPVSALLQPCFLKPEGMTNPVRLGDHFTA